MKESLAGVTGSIVVAMIHKGHFDGIKENKERVKVISETILEVAKAFS